MAIIDNVVFYYTKIQQPSKKYQSDDTEYSVDCAVSKAEAKIWNKTFSKQKAKVLDNDEFIEKYKVDVVPFEDQDEQYIVKLKKNACKGGVETPEKWRPKVLIPSAAGNIDITATKLVSNGSKGKASYTVVENDFGTFAQLSAILVTDLIEYKSAAAGAGSEFGDFIADPSSPAPKKAESKEESFDDLPSAAPSKAKPKAKPVPVEDDLDESPF